MLDRVDAGQDRVPRGLVAMAVGGDLLPQAMGLVDKADISSGVSCGVSTSSASESTPPEAQNLITSAPYLTWNRTASRNPAGPWAMPSAGPSSRSRSWRIPLRSACPPRAPRL